MSGNLHAVYKCRLCGEEEIKCSTSAAKSNQKFVREMMCRTVMMREPKEPMEPTLFEFHLCKDGSVGVMDFLGMRLEDGKNE